MSEKLKTDLSKFNNSWFSKGANPFKLYLWYFVRETFFHSAFPLSSVKVALLRMFGARVGKGVVIKPHIIIKFPWKLKVGNYVWIGEKVWIENHALVSIENNVCISQGAVLVGGNHDYKKPGFDLITGEIELKEGSWVGAGAMVCPGTKLESHAVLTMGSVGSGVLEAYSIYQGNIAVKIKDRIIRS